MKFTLVSRSISKLLDLQSMKLLDHYSRYNPSPLTIKQFVEFGQTGSVEDSFVFLRKEIPVRLSNIMKEFSLLPRNLQEMPSVLLVQNSLAQTFSELMEFEPCTACDQHTLSTFCLVLQRVRDSHANSVQAMAQGVLELKESHHVDSQAEMSIQYFLDRFYMSRISLRMLINQHVYLFEAGADQDTSYVGMIDSHCQLKSTLMKAFDDSSFLCKEYYGCSPEIKLKGHTIMKNAPLELVYPQAHLYHILFELLKNSMRATVETHHNAHELPLIEVLVAKGEHDVSIRVSDQGGGIPRHITDLMFHYLFSTAPRPSLTPSKTPLAGYGYGLPLSRLYARYLHGDLILYSYDGYGTDAVVYLKSATHQAVELLPVFNKTSSRIYRSSASAADWTNPAYSQGTFSRTSGRY